MSRLVEEVANPDYADTFTDKIHCQSRCTAPEHPGHGVELLTTGLQVGPGYKEVGCRKEGCSRGLRSATVQTRPVSLSISMPKAKQRDASPKDAPDLVQSCNCPLS